MFSVIYNNIAVFNFHRFPGKPDYSFNVIPGSIQWVVKHHHISPNRLFEIIAYLINNQILAVFKIRLHRGAFNEKRLKDKIADQARQN